MPPKYTAERRFGLILNQERHFCILNGRMESLKWYICSIFTLDDSPICSLSPTCPNMPNMPPFTQSSYCVLYRFNLGCVTTKQKKYLKAHTLLLFINSLNFFVAFFTESVSLCATETRNAEPRRYLHK